MEEVSSTIYTHSDSYVPLQQVLVNLLDIPFII